MKKALIIAAACVGAAGAFLAALVALINARGGLSPRYAGLQRAPVLGGMITVKQAEQSGEKAPTEGKGGRDAPYLSLGAEAEVARLAQELELKKGEYEARLLELKRRSRELEAWEKQMKVERDKLREHFAAEKQELAALREELKRKEEALNARQIQIDENEEDNLSSTAGIYDRMSPEQAAKILMEMYSDGREDVVVKIIYLMQDRTAAKTLESFSDPKIGAQVTERLRRIAPPDKLGG